MSLEFDTGVIDLLCKCQLLHLRKHFIETKTTKSELQELVKRKPMKVVKRRLHQLLPSDTPNLGAVISTIIQELDNDEDSVSEDDDLPPPQKIKKELKIEPKTEWNTDDEEEIQILDEIPPAVSIQLELRSKVRTCIEIQEEDQMSQDGSNATVALNSATSGSPSTVTNHISTAPGRDYCIVNIIQEALKYPNTEDPQNGGPPRKRKLGNYKSRESSWGFVENWCWSDWTTQIDLELEDIHELHIFAPSEKVETFPNQLSLPNLKSLEVSHSGLINYGEELKTIIQGTGGSLEELHFVQEADDSLSTFLSILKHLEPPTLLANLKYLQIQSADTVSRPIVSAHLELLAEINAPALQELYFGYSFSDNCQPALEKVLNKFSTLTQFRIMGCFVTKSKVQPSITINFPSAMPNLEMLELGSDTKNVSNTFENETERPPKKTKFPTAQERVIQEEVDQETGQSTPTPESDSEEVFSVTLNLPVLPSLTSLILGASYNLQDLHFSKMKNLRVFRVSSPWNHSVKFPKPERNKVYPNLKELQFPDYLRDHSFVQPVISYFPGVTKWYFNFPGVDAIRAFAAGLHAANRKLELLDISLQYDFPSSLAWIMLNDPWTSVIPTEEELRKIQLLKDYPHFKEYVRVNQIEVPNHTDPALGLNSDDNEAEAEPVLQRFMGLEALQKKFTAPRIKKVNNYTKTKTEKTLLLKCVPRTLRLPKGPFHFNDDRCEFTNTLIGFQENEYPLSFQAWSKMPQGIQLLGFDMSEAPVKKTRVQDDRNLCGVKSIKPFRLQSQPK